MIKKDGGPAFPVSHSPDQVVDEGLTKHQWYKTFAPEVPEWFLSAKDLRTNIAMDDGERFFRWRTYYADKMVGGEE